MTYQIPTLLSPNPPSCSAYIPTPYQHNTGARNTTPRGPKETKKQETLASTCHSAKFDRWQSRGKYGINTRNDLLRKQAEPHYETRIHPCLTGVWLLDKAGVSGSEEERKRRLEQNGGGVLELGVLWWSAKTRIVEVGRGRCLSVCSYVLTLGWDDLRDRQVMIEMTNVQIVRWSIDQAGSRDYQIIVMIGCIDSASGNDVVYGIGNFGMTTCVKRPEMVYPWGRSQE